MIFIGFLIATSYTITVLIAEYLQVEALAVHFKAFRFFTITSQLLYFLYFELLFPFFFFLINIHSPKVVQSNIFLLRKYNTPPVVKLMIILSSGLHDKILLFVVIISWCLVNDRSMRLNETRGVFDIHLVLTVTLLIPPLILAPRPQRYPNMIFASIFIQYLIMQEIILLLLDVDIMILFRQR